MDEIFGAGTFVVHCLEKELRLTRGMTSVSI